MLERNLEFNLGCEPQLQFSGIPPDFFAGQFGSLCGNESTAA
jgi:hypothetical protein